MYTTEQLQSLFRYGFSLTSDEQSAHDILQDAIETCLRKPPIQSQALISYTRSIMRNKFIDQTRHNKRFPMESIEDDTSAVDLDVRMLEDVVIDSVLLDTIWKELDTIEREILYLWAVEGFTTSELAEQLAKPKGTILSIIHRLRKRLQALPGYQAVRG